MAYTPINTQAYTASFSGAVAGMAVNGWISSPQGSNYILVCAIAGAFAQAFDVAWNNADPVNGLEYSAIQQVCQQEFAQRGPGPLAAPQFIDPANWAVAAKACATLALQCDLYFAGQGITPPTFGASSAKVLLASFGSPIAPVAPGGSEPTNAFTMPYTLQADEVLIVEVMTRIATANLPAPATSYINGGIELQLSTDGGSTFNTVASDQFVANLVAPPNPGSDAPQEYYVSQKYQLTPLISPPTGNNIGWKVVMSSNAASDDTYTTFDIQAQFTQGVLIQ